MRQGLDVVFAADDLYARGLAVAVRSVEETAGSEVDLHVFVIDGGLSPETRLRLSSSWRGIDFTFLDVDRSRVGRMPLSFKPEGLHINTSMWLRVLAPMVVPLRVSRMIYLDSDVIVRTNLGALAAMDLGRSLIAAVPDEHIPCFSARWGLPNYAEQGFSGAEPYFNSGVLVCDLAGWRAHDLTTAILRYAELHSSAMRFPDQEALNVTFHGRWFPMDLSWNDIEFAEIDKVDKVHDTRAKDRLAGTRIAHFTGPEKPWRANYQGPLGLEMFREIEGRTAWAGSPQEDWQPSGCTSAPT